MMPHGTHGRYVAGPCRCQACTTANRVYCANRKKQRRAYLEANGLPSSVEHGINAYLSWSCRCDVCRTAWAAYQKVYRQKAGRS